MKEKHNYRRHRRSIFWPLLLMAAGGVLLANTLGYLPGDAAWNLLRLWPLLFIVGALDNLYQGESFVFPVVMLGAGTVFLLSNLGYLAGDAWRLLLQFWPILLIAFGLDLLISRRSPLGAIFGVLIGLALLAGTAWLASGVFSLPVQTTPTEVSIPLKDAGRGELTIEATAGRLNLESGAAADQFLSGEVVLGNSERLVKSEQYKDGMIDVNLRSRGLFYVIPFSSQTNHTGWDFVLNENTPVELVTQMAAGMQELDLRDTRVSRLDSETALGRTEVILPEGGKLSGSVSAALGSIVVRVPRGTQVEFEVDRALTSLSLDSGFVREGNRVRTEDGGAGQISLQLEAAMGSIRIEWID